MTPEEAQELVFELRYWQQIADDLGEIGRHIGKIGAKRPMAYAGAGDLITFILGHIEDIGKLTLGMQDLVSGRLTAIAGKLDRDG